MRYSIRTRFTIAFIALAVVPLLLVGGIVSWQSFSAQREQALELQDEVARRSAERVADYITGLHNELLAVAQILDLVNLPVGEQRTVLSKLLAHGDRFEALALLDGQGQETVRITRTDLVTTFDLRKRSGADEFVLPMSTGETYYSPVWFDPEIGQPFMTLGLPLTDVRSGKESGVLVADLRLKEIWEVIADIPAGEADIAYIVDMQGRVVAHRNPSVVLRGTQFAIPDSGGINDGLDGKSVVLARQEVVLGGQTLHIVTERPLSDALALTIRTGIITGALTVATLVIATVIGVLTVRRLVRPIQRLAYTAQAISSGDLSQTAEVTGQDELGVLANAFNKMTAQLKKTINSLEERVADRTQQLSDINAELEVEISERKRIEEALERHGEELTRSNSELEQFAYVASHDLQEPIRKIQAFGNRLRVAVGDNLDSRASDYLNRMQDAAGRGQVLINDLLTYSRVTSRAQPFVSVDLGVVARNVIADLDVQVQGEGARVEVDWLPTIEADPVQMRQLFHNLIGNALKFHRDGAPPVVKISSEILGELRQPSPDNSWVNGHCQITIKDNGIGFDEKYLDRIFTIFQRLHGRSAFEGTGIGLAVCRKIADHHGGTITAKSRPGEGATFIVTLPVSNGEVESQNE